MGWSVKSIYCLILLLAVSAIPAHSGVATVKDTDAGIVVEYAPDAEDTKNVQDEQLNAERIKAAEEERLRKEEEHNAKWRALAEEGRAQRRAAGEPDDGENQ